jgi:hypothetical protein
LLSQRAARDDGKDRAAKDPKNDLQHQPRTGADKKNEELLEVKAGYLARICLIEGNIDEQTDTEDKYIAAGDGQRGQCRYWPVDSGAAEQLFRWQPARYVHRAAITFIY